MPQVIVTEGAAEGLERCRRFFAAKAPEAARRAGQSIERQFLLLETAPDIGRPLLEMPDLRELVLLMGRMLRRHQLFAANPRLTQPCSPAW